MREPPSEKKRWKALAPWAPWTRVLEKVGGAIPLFVTAAAAGKFLPNWILATLLFLWALGAAASFAKQQVDVASDGLRTRWLGRNRILRYEDIEEVHQTRFGVKLALRGGRTTEFRLTQRTGAGAEDARAFARAIDDALRVYRASAPVVDEAVLARGARGYEEWLMDLRAIGTEGVGGYRVPQMTEDRLWEVVRNPCADASAREGAAIALRVRVGGERGDVREHLRVVADATAEPQLRTAFVRIADATDDELLGEEEPRAVARRSVTAAR